VVSVTQPQASGQRVDQCWIHAACVDSGRIRAALARNVGWSHSATARAWVS
jgi:hypothetical protein